MIILKRYLRKIKKKLFDITKYLRISKTNLKVNHSKKMEVKRKLNNKNCQKNKRKR